MWRRSGREARLAESGNVKQRGYGDAVFVAADWFSRHVSLDGKPYTLDLDQAQAAIDNHKNTLVTARAGSGKTRVIVAKVAYLLAHQLAMPDEIAIFMFNRTAAAEVNARIAAVKVDGRSLIPDGRPSQMASTFHKFALDTVKLAHERPQIISEFEQSRLVGQTLDQILAAKEIKLSLRDRQELLNIVKGFIARAGQQFPGHDGLASLNRAITNYIKRHQTQSDYHRRIRLHQIAQAVYAHYLSALQTPQTDFNLLMARATEILHTGSSQACNRVRPSKYILIDEYQDFSYLFFALVLAMRELAPAAHLLAVGDDWQAINRFAGSDVNYFIHFAEYFPEDSINLPLATNYRSDRRIVEQANRYMLEHYDPKALPAIPKSKAPGRIYHYNPNRQRFNTLDITEDALGDGIYHQALLDAMSQASPHSPSPRYEALKLVKQIVQIVRRHPFESIMLLHRHNFTTFDGVTLEILRTAVRTAVVKQGIMSNKDFDAQVRCMTMHKSKGLEADVVLLLELNRDLIHGMHPYATLFEIFGDTREAEIADQERLLYVALTRAKHKLYLLSTDKKPII